MRLADGIRQQLPAWSGYCGLQRPDDEPAEATASERARKPDDGDDRLHEDKCGRIGQGTGMAETAGDAQAKDRVPEQLTATARPKDAPGVVPVELPRLGNGRRGAQAAL